MLSIIVAFGEKYEIGKKGQLLWLLPKDLKYFSQKTRNCVIIMGRKTFDSIGKVLPSRQSIVITSQKDWEFENVIRAENINNAIFLAKEFLNNNSNYNEEIFIIGGGEIYKQSIDLVERIYATEVKGTFEDCDTFFPVIDKSKFQEISRVENKEDENHTYPFDFCIYEKYDIKNI